MISKSVYHFLAFIVITMTLPFSNQIFSQTVDNHIAESGSDMINKDPDHPYLNTINWMIVQPLDMSSAKITTTAKSTASEVHFYHSCDDMEISSVAVPDEDGDVSDTLETTCKSVLITRIIAVENDSTIQTIQMIDINFLNSLEQ